MEEVEFYILEKEGKQSAMLQYLHELICSYPNIVAKIRYKIPFYYQKSWLCYLNPVKDDRVELAFTRGNELSNVQGLLQSNGRKQVFGITFSSVKEIPEELIHEIFQEALLLDEEVPYKSKRSKS